MTRIWTLVLTVVALMSVAAPAAADPVTGWLAVNVFGWAGATMGAFLAGAVVSLGTGILGAALTGAMSETGQNYDVKFDVEFGDDTALTFTVGDFATAGKRRFIAKWGRETRFITEVIEVSSLPQGFGGAWVDDERADVMAGKMGAVRSAGSTLFTPARTGSVTAFDLGAVPGDHVAVGWPLSNMKDDEGEGDLGARIWVKWIDGTQTAADPFLLWAFGEDADYPWTADHIGTGKTYVIVTTRFDSETLTSYPTYLWEPEPLPLYDPRYDSTAGGQGAQRWGDRATYQPSRNAAVISYNIARGIYWGDEWLFGGKNMAAWRLPVAEWMAAMNACDMPVALAEGGTEPAYRAGLQITVSDEPLGVMEEIGKGANMRYAEVGGMLKPVVGLPAAPVFAITDADIVISEGQSLTPFAPASQTFNTITATFPDPTAKWASRDAPEYISEAGVAADGGRHLPTSLSYPAVPYPHQVQRLMRAQLEDYRRDTIVEFSLHPGAYALEPLVDTISWTSARNGYDAKQFVVEQITKLPGMNVTVRLREVDPADYDWSPSFELPYDSVAPVPEIPWVQAIDGWTAVASIERDANGSGRVAAILVGCDGDSVAIAQVRIQVRRAGEAQPTVDALRPYDAPYRWKILGVAPSTTYEVRGALQSELTGRYDWSDWITVTTPDITVGVAELTEELRQSLETLDAWISAGLADLPGVIIAIEEIQDALIASVTDLEGQQAATSNAVSELSTRVTNAEGQLSTQASALTSLNSTVSGLALAQAGTATAVDNLTTRVITTEEGMTALSESLTTVDARVGALWAGGYLRMTTEASGAGAVARVGLKAVAGSDEDQNARSAALYLEATSDGQSRVIVQANQFAVAAGNGSTFPFVVNGNQVFIRGAMIEADSLTLPLFANGVLQTALYPVRVDIFMSSLTNWQPPMEGLAAAYVIGGGGGGGAVYQGYYNNQAGQGYRPMFAGGGGSGGFGWNFIPNLRFNQRFNIFVGAGGNGGWVSGGAQEGWGWDGGASHIYNLNAGGWSESQIINVWAAGGQSGWVGSREATPNRWSPPRQSGHATGGRWNSPGYGNTHDMSVHIGAGGSSADFGLGVDRWGNPFGEGQQGGMREAWPAIFNGLEVTGLPFKGLYGNDFRGGAGNVHGWEGNGGYGGGGAGRSTHDYRGDDGGTNGSRDVAGGNGGQGFVMVVYYGQGNLK